MTEHTKADPTLFPKVGSTWWHRNGNVYRVIAVNEEIFKQSDNRAIKKKVASDLRRYGAQKKAAWEALRRVLKGEAS